MAQRHGQSVRSVRRLRCFVHGEQRPYHQLHLTLARVAVPGDVGFHFARGVAVHFQAVLCGRQKNHASHFRQAQRGAHVERRENALNGHGVGGKLFDQPAQ